MPSPSGNDQLDQVPNFKVAYSLTHSTNKEVPEFSRPGSSLPVQSLHFGLFIAVFHEPLFSGGQLTPSFENRGSIKIVEGQLDLTPSGETAD